jgi:hypothetical protein
VNVLKDLVQYLFQLGQSEKTTKVIPVPGAPPHRALIQKPDGKCEWQDLEPTARAHTASDLSTVIQFAEENKDACRVWISEALVCCVLDDETRRDRVTLELERSGQVKILSGVSGTNFGQRDIILFLRTNFSDCMGPCVGLLNSLRVLKFVNNAGGESTVQQGKVSIGRAIEQSVTGADSIPEEVTFDVPMYAAGFTCFESIRLAVDIDTQTQKFKLIPLAGEIDRAYERSQEKMRKHLIENLPKGVKVCVGNP